ncbi:MAG: peptide chain release factor N(5)-glutamine methyltransferase [Pseudomonadota bacterium]
MTSEPLTLHAVVRLVSERLQAAGTETAAAEARRLVCEALAIDPVALIRDPQTQLDQAQIDNVFHWLQRREQGEPLARIRGWQEFYGRRFQLSDATLEPRADTETLINAALAIADASHGRDYPWRILDVGTGTGCIAITLLAELQHAVVTATDISAHAIHTALLNAQEHRVEERLAGQVTNLAEGLTLDYDLIVSNPPYIKTSDIAGLQTEVKGFDPTDALDGGGSGLVYYEELGRQLSKAGWTGHLIVEIAVDDHERVIAGFEQVGLKFIRGAVQLWRDLTGRVRCVAIETLC